MIRKLGTQIRNQWMGALALFLVLGGGTAWALDANTVGSRQVKNFTLNDQDVGQTTVVDFAGNIGDVPANGCISPEVTGIPVGGDHLLLTPSRADADIRLEYTIEYDHPDADQTEIIVCNHTSSLVEDGITHFNLIAFDAQ